VYPITRAIEDGYLVKPNAFRILTDLDLDKVKLARKNGETDFQSEELQSVINTPGRNSTIVDAYLRRALGVRAVAFCVGVQHAYDLANAFRKVGVEAHAIHGELPLDERRDLLGRHQRGEFPVITNCAVLTHGYDDPGLGCVIMARPTQSKTLYVQCLGRGLRIAPNKAECIVLDIVDCTKNHKLLIADEILQLQQEMSGEQEATEPRGQIRAGLEPGLGVGQGKEQKKWSNEDAPERWRAKQVDLLAKQEAKEREKQERAAGPPTAAQRRFIYAKLSREFGWPDDAARRAAGDKALTRGNVPKFLGRVKYGVIGPQHFA
jgi:superfamily II DNA or RNA helicase